MAEAELIEPLILGSGAAGEALRHALALFPDDVARPRPLARGEPLPSPTGERALLVLANPHALHASRLLEATARGYRFAICEKPAAVDLEQVRQLRALSTGPLRAGVCHGYRLMWGPEE